MKASTELLLLLLVEAMGWNGDLPLVSLVSLGSLVTACEGLAISARYLAHAQLLLLLLPAVKGAPS